MKIDELDVRIIELLEQDPRTNGVDAAQKLGVARATYQSRLDRLISSGVLSLTPTVNPAAIGFSVTAFISAEITQSGRGPGLIATLNAIPEVTEISTVTGSSDLLIRAVAVSNSDLQRVLDQIARHDDVLRTSTAIALDNQLPSRTVQLARRRLSMRDENNS